MHTGERETGYKTEKELLAQLSATLCPCELTSSTLWVTCGLMRQSSFLFSDFLRGRHVEASALPEANSTLIHKVGNTTLCNEV